MKFFPAKKPRDATKETPSPKSKAPVKTSGWTNGPLLGAKAVSVIVVIGWLCAPAALVVAFAKPTSRPVAAVESAEAPLTALQQSAGAFSVGFVGAWLSSTTNDMTALSPYISTTPASVGEQAFDNRNLTVAEIVPADGTDLVSVLVSADVYEKPVADEDPLWVRRYFEVVVDTAGGKLAALGLPAPKAGPTTGKATEGLTFSNQLQGTSPAAETVTLFLTAYLTGQGSTSSYLTPGVQIAPIGPAPYSELAPSTLYANQPPAEDPADGDAIHVQATVALQNANGQAVTATYWLHLTARTGRWEVTDLSATAPNQSETPAATPAPPTPTPSSTDDTTEGDSK